MPKAIVIEDASGNQTTIIKEIDLPEDEVKTTLTNDNSFPTPNELNSIAKEYLIVEIKNQLIKEKLSGMKHKSFSMEISREYSVQIKEMLESSEYKVRLECENSWCDYMIVEWD